MPVQKKSGNILNSPRRWLICIMAIKNTDGDSGSPGNILLWIFASCKLFPPAVNSTLQILMVFSNKLMTLSDILYILRQFIYQLCGTYPMSFCCESRP